MNSNPLVRVCLAGLALLAAAFAQQPTTVIVNTNGGGGGGGSQYSAAPATYAAGTYYFPPAGGAPANASRTAVQVVQGSAGAVSNFAVSLLPPLGAGVSAAVTVYDGAAGMATTCTATASGGCTDITHTSAYNAGDALSVQMVTAGGSYTGIVAFNFGTGQAGPAGAAGQSVTATVESPGVNCAAGGVKLVSASGTNYACNGAAGTNGSAGTNGTNGTNGQSVTVTVESAGANCTYGGEKLVSANGTAYVCNGAPGSGGAGIVTLVTQAGAPSGACSAPSSSNLALSFDTTNSVLYYCNASTPTWRKFLDDGTNSSKTGYLSMTGVTSGSAGFTVDDTAGTAILYVLPSINGAAGQLLLDTGSTTCPTLPTGAASTCHQLAWLTPIYPQTFFGTAAPGSVSGNLPGDLFSDTTNHNLYQCNAASGTAAPACTSVATGGWMLVNGTGAGLPNITGPVMANGLSAATAATAHQLQTPLQCADTSASSTAQSCATTPTFTAAAGDRIIYTTTTANTGDLTINVNASSAVHVRKWQGSAILAAGDLKANVNVPLTFDGTYWEVGGNIGNAPAGSSPVHVIAFTVDGGGAAITAGTAYVGQLPGACAINGWSLAADQPGSISIDLDGHANASQAAAPAVPNTTTDKISASAPMVLSSAQSAASTTLTGWTTSRAVWDSFAVNVTSATTVTKVTGQVFCQ
jgi:hypothetical protein